MDELLSSSVDVLYTSQSLDQVLLTLGRVAFVLNSLVSDSGNHASTSSLLSLLHSLHLTAPIDREGTLGAHGDEPLELAKGFEALFQGLRSETARQQLRLDLQTRPSSRAGFRTLVETILSSHFLTQWLPQLGQAERHELYNVIFNHAVHVVDVFQVLMRELAALHDSSNTAPLGETNITKQNEQWRLRITVLVKRLASIFRYRLRELLLAEEVASLKVDAMFRLVLSVPDRVLNACALTISVPSELAQMSFFHRLVSTIADAYRSECLSSMVVSLWISLLSSRGYAALIVEAILLPSSSNLNWHSVLKMLEEQSLEPLLCELCRQLKYPMATRGAELVTCLLQHHERTRFILIEKILVARPLSGDALMTLCELIALVAIPDFLEQTVERLFEIWKDGLFVRHAPEDRHLQVSRALMACLCRVDKPSAATHATAWMLLSVQGVQAHLDNPNSYKRQLGMVAAEIISQILTPSRILDFELEGREDNAAVQDLAPFGKRTLVTSTPAVSAAPISTTMTNDALKVAELHHQVPDIARQREPVNGLDEDDEADADSLEAYDISDDEVDPLAGDMSTARTQARRSAPSYVRECVELLQKQDDPDGFELALSSLERIIRANPSDLNYDGGRDLLIILLSLENRYASPLFSAQVMNAMIATAVTAPAQAAALLPSHFFIRNLSLKQRADILTVIEEMSRELSAPPSRPRDESKGLAGNKKELPALLEEPVSPAAIIAKRINAKTRRFTNGRSRPAADASANRLAPFAISLFFPLLAGIETAPVDLGDRENGLLARLLYTAAIVLHNVGGQSCAVAMSRAALNFVWSYHYTAFPMVRRSLLFLLSGALSSVSLDVLLADMSVELMEMREWVADLFENDPDTECRELSYLVMSQFVDSTKAIQ